ncbi:hypothetical protein ABTN72_20335, partial [Acinetobacter baumannii]
GYSTPNSSNTSAAATPFVMIGGVATNITVAGTRAIATDINIKGVVTGYVASPLQGWFGNASGVTMLVPPAGQTDIAA